MPTYRYRCEVCKNEQDAVRRVADRDDAPVCHEPMTRIFCAPRIYIPMEINYKSPIDDRIISGKRARQDDLRRSGSRPWEGLESERREAARQEQYREQAADASLERAAAETLHQLPPSKRDVLKELSK